MRRFAILITTTALLATACGAGPEPVALDAPPDAALVAPAATVAPSTVLPTTPPPVATTSSTAAPTTTTTLPPPSVATSTTPSPCPNLGSPGGADAVIRDVELKAIELGSAEEPWTMSLGSELPSMAIGKRSLFLGMTDGVVIALDPETCEQRWRTAVAPANIRLNTVGDLVVADGPDFIGALDADTGEILWARPQRFPFGVVAMIRDDVVLVTVEGYGVLGVDLFTGVQLFDWAFENAPLRNVTADELHVYAGGKGIIARPLHGGGIVWESNVDADLLTAADGYVLAAKDDGTVSAFDATDGTLLWTQQLEGVTGYDAPAAVDHKEAHFLDYNARLHHLDLEDGSIVFQGTFVPGLTFAEFDDATVLIQDRGVVTAIDLSHRERFGLVTGANGIDRFTAVELFRNTAITLSWSEG